MLLPFIVNCELSQWGEFDECTKPCGGGTMTKNRTITVPPQHGGQDCDALSEKQACNVDPCPSK